MKKKPRKNLFTKGKTELFESIDEFVQIFLQSSKLIIQPNIKEVDSLPDKKCLKHIIEHFELDEVFFDKLVLDFNQLIYIDSLARSIVKEGGGKQMLKKTNSYRALAKKRNLQKRLLEDLIKKIWMDFKVNETLKNRSLKLYSATVNSSMLFPPPKKISVTCYEKWISKLSVDESTYIKSAYYKDGNSYRKYESLNYQKIKKVSSIIFNLKHCMS